MTSRCLLACLSAVLLLVTSAKVDAQLTVVTNEGNAVTQRLVLETLLANPQTETQNIPDPVWELKPAPGRMFIQVPIHFAPVKETVEVKAPAVDVGASRFVCWRIDPQPKQTGTTTISNSNNDATNTLTPVQRADALLLTTEQFQKLHGNTTSAARTDGTTNSSPRQRQVKTVLPSDASRVTRELKLLPDRAISWTLDRAIVGMQIIPGDQPYKLKLRSDRLRDLRPERPERPTRNAGEDARDYRLRVRKVEDVYRDAMRDYRELSSKVRELPEDFVVTDVEQVYAVFELSTSLRTLKFEGAAPLPWTPSSEMFQQLRNWMRQPPSSAGGTTLSDAQLQTIETLTASLQQQQPLTYQAAALVIEKMNVTKRVEMDSSLYTLLQRIVAGPSNPARLLIVKQLAAALPPTQATTSLLAEAAKQMSSQEQWVTLSGMMNATLSDEKSSELLVATTNRILALPDGQDVFEVLAPLAKKQASNSKLREKLVSELDFASMPKPRREQAYRFVARYAGVLPGVNDWLQLNILSDASQANEALAFISNLRETDKTAVLAAWPIRNTSDGMVALLKTEDAAPDSPAWQALLGFVLKKQAAKTTEQDEPDLIVVLTEAGLQHRDTPQTLVPFLVAQDTASNPNPTFSESITTSLMQTMIQGSELARQQATAMLVGTGRDLNKSLATFSPNERAVIVRRLWANRAKSSLAETPLLLGVIRDDDAVEAMAALLADPEQAQPVPSVKAMAKAAGSEADLLTKLTGDDTKLRRAVVAALVIQSDGDETFARRLAEDFINAQDQTEDGMRRLWQESREDLAMRNITAAEGRYRLTLKVTPFPKPEADEAAGDEAAAEQPKPDKPADKPDGEKPLETYELGIVNMKVDGMTVSFNNGLILKPMVQTSQLALEQPATLKLFNVEGVAELPLEQAEAPLVLTRDAKGVWTGESKIPDSRMQGKMILIMTPVTMGQP